MVLIILIFDRIIMLVFLNIIGYLYGLLLFFVVEEIIIFKFFFKLNEDG